MRFIYRCLAGHETGDSIEASKAVAVLDWWVMCPFNIEGGEECGKPARLTDVWRADMDSPLRPRRR